MDITILMKVLQSINLQKYFFKNILSTKTIFNDEQILWRQIICNACTCSWNTGKLFQNLNACKAIYEFDKKIQRKNILWFFSQFKYRYTILNPKASTVSFAKCFPQPSNIFCKSDPKRGMTMNRKFSLSLWWVPWAIYFGTPRYFIFLFLTQSSTVTVNMMYIY